MARDKARDDKFFNCQQEHEDHYVSSLYSDNIIVSMFLQRKCKSNEIKYSTHKEVYELIEGKLGFPIPN